MWRNDPKNDFDLSFFLEINCTFCLGSFFLELEYQVVNEWLAIFIFFFFTYSFMSTNNPECSFEPWVKPVIKNSSSIMRYFFSDKRKERIFDLNTVVIQYTILLYSSRNTYELPQCINVAPKFRRKDHKGSPDGIYLGYSHILFACLVTCSPNSLRVLILIFV